MADVRKANKGGGSELEPLVDDPLEPSPVVEALSAVVVGVEVVELEPVVSVAAGPGPHAVRMRVRRRVRRGTRPCLHVVNGAAIPADVRATPAQTTTEHDGKLHGLRRLVDAEVAAKGGTIADLAQRLDVHPVMLYRLAACSTGAALKTAQRIAAGLHCSLDDLVVPSANG